MSSKPNGARARADACARTSSRGIASALARFPEPARRRVLAAARHHTALAELAQTYPALLAAVAMPGQESVKHRAAAVELINRGAPLRVPARLFGVPGWTRRLPPEAFTGPLPQLPVSESFACRIANVLPAPRHAARWLQMVARGFAACDETFALWVAQNFEAVAPQLPVRRLHLLPERSCIDTLALFAFFSRAAGTPAHALIERAWRPAMLGQAARAAAEMWLERIQIELYLDASRVNDHWLAPARTGGIDFVPLEGREAIVEEARVMEHCVLSYAAAVAQGRCRLWSLRRGGARVATLEIGPAGREIRRPVIVQLQGPRNSDVDEDVWRATHAWLAEQKELVCTPPDDCEPDARVWRRLWMPYWRRHGLSDWLPPTPAVNCVWQLSRWL